MVDEEREGDVPAPLGSWIAPDYEVVAEFDFMQTGVTVSPTGRIFVSFPRWGDDVSFTVAEVVDGRPVPYPDSTVNRLDEANPATTFVSVQSVIVDPAERLWAVDTGSLAFAPHLPRGPKLVEIDLGSDKVARIIPIEGAATTPTTYINDVRFDLSRGEDGYAYVSDCDPTGALIVVDLATGDCWAKLRGHPTTSAQPDFRAIVEGRMRDNYVVGVDGIAVSADGSRLYYCPLSSRRLYSVAADLLTDESASDEAVAESIIDHGDKGASDGLESDAAGAVYSTSYEHSAVLRLDPDGTWTTLMHGPDLLWPDTLALADDGYLYLSANQLPRAPLFNANVDDRLPPYKIVRKAITGAPVRLTR
ncbi:L-dopachrome tautomerase-related protein [Actinopolymorpha pittospori]|uniref:Sugar lactone lactonase YvrE n=1 Tax=Actinopolymorpha pittospori TaxID=648752 RepID=A0A927MSB9_9ACTN|nr:L-dopachrome tautomerase-related protein [Actinopolymorpha pittospori]MBE1604343.1 sugar lactone lactonase YvrE [Actinopolymorpha pittospori]